MITPPTTPQKLEDFLRDMSRPHKRHNEIFHASDQDQDTDKIKLSREQEAKLCSQYKLGFYVVTESGVITFRHRPCQHYDLCEGCRKFEATQRNNVREANIEEYKKKHPNAKSRVMKNVPEDQIDTITKRIKRRGGELHTVVGEEAGTRDIIAIVEDDPRKDEQQNAEFFGIEEAEYDYEAALARQAEMSANGEQKRMAGSLLKKKQGPTQKDTYLLRLPKFRIRQADRNTVDRIAKKVLPRREADNDKEHQAILYDIANEFAGLLEDRGIEYDVKMTFKNVTEESRKELNSLVQCPNNSISIKDNAVNRTKDTSESSEIVSEMDIFYREYIYPGTKL